MGSLGATILDHRQPFLTPVLTGAGAENVCCSVLPDFKTGEKLNFKKCMCAVCVCMYVCVCKGGGGRGGDT